MENKIEILYGELIALIKNGYQFESAMCAIAENVDSSVTMSMSGDDWDAIEKLYHEDFLGN